MADSKDSKHARNEPETEDGVSDGSGGSGGSGGEAKVVLNEDFRNIVIVDNIPQVPMEKYQKLCEVIRKIYSLYGKIVPEGFFVPTEGTPAKTSGYAFIEYESVEGADRALTEGDNKPLDAAHVLRVTRYSDFDKYINMSDEYVAPPKADLEVKFNPNGWLLDKEGRDQFLLRFSQIEQRQTKHETHIFWSDPLNKPNVADACREAVYDGGREKARGKAWTELYTQWSPRGSYLATFHVQGIVLWAGDDFQKIGRFAHQNVKNIDFSPCEKYLVTCTYDPRAMKHEKFLIVWDVARQTELRWFDAAGSMAWPAFRWSFDDKYFTRCGKDMISVYETPGMGLLDKKSIKLPNVQACDISPTDNIVSYWVPERDNGPAVISLMSIPSKKTLREKHVYFVTDVQMHWQQNGDFLCCKITRKKAKKPLPAMFLIYRLRAPDIPVEEFELNDSIHAFAWEPKGTRFAIAHGESTGGRCNVSFYNIKKQKAELIKTLEGRTCNGLFWSPAGLYCILGGLGAMGGTLEFVDTTSVTTVANHDHFQCTDIDWSPCGRYLMTASTQPLDPGKDFKSTIENGYKLWNMQGRQLLSKPCEQLFQSLWRPRPPSTLPAGQKEEKYLRDKYWATFTAKDQKTRESQLSGVAAERLKLRDEWKAIRLAHLNDYNEEAPMRAELRNGLLSDEEEDFETIETVVEEEVSRTEEVVSNKEYIAGTAAKKAEKDKFQAAAAASAPTPRDSKEDDD